MNKQTFEAVCDKIKTELAYQESMALQWDNGNKPSVEAEILLLSCYLRKVEEAWQTSHGSEPALDVMRKIAGICTRALMNHGCPERDYKPLPP